jgi:hypothetical protein
VIFQQANGLARCIVDRAGDRLAMVTPCSGQLLLSTESKQTSERRYMLAANGLAPPKRTAHQCRCPSHQVFDGQYVERTGLVVKRRRPRESIPKRSEEVHPNCSRFVNQLQQGSTVSHIWVNVVQKKGRRNRFGNRAESIHDEVDVVQAPSFERTTVRTELRSGRQPARQSASNTVGEDGFHSCSRSTRIVFVQ